MADYAGLAIDAGARIVGGCCGNNAGACRGDAPRPRRSRARPAAERRDDRRRARAAGLAAAAPPAAARRAAASRRMNSKAKRRAWSAEASLKPPCRPVPSPPLRRPFRPPGFRGRSGGRGRTARPFPRRARQRARACPLAHPAQGADRGRARSRVDGAVARDPAMRLAAGRADRVRSRRRPSEFAARRPRTCRSTSSSRTSI